MNKTSLQKLNKISIVSALLVGLTVLSGCARSSTAPGTSGRLSANLGEPTGAGFEAKIDIPDVEPAMVVVDNYKRQLLYDENGKKIDKNYTKSNPIISLLSGFETIWTLGDSDWANGAATGKGYPKDFSMTRILDAEVWKANMSYVLKVAGPQRSEADALYAYYDDRRPKHYSVIDGLGPLAPIYKKGANATTTLDHKADGFHVNKVITVKEKDKGTGPGTTDSALGEFVSFMKIIRGPEGTTSPAKYFYSSPRPWRMTDVGRVIKTGTEKIGNKTFGVHKSNVKVIPALLYARETRGRKKDCAYPSGHTNAAYLSAFAYAYAIPERFSEMVTRASELGESRIIAGMHSPLDIIGGRTMATAMAAAYLNDPDYADAKMAAYQNVHDYFEKSIGDETAVIAFAQTWAKQDRYSDDAANKKLYRWRLTYGFKQDPAKSGQEMIVPKGAEVLLETRLPYLSDAQRRVVLFTTGIDSGYPVLDSTHGWGRLDLVSAADGYGSFYGDVYLTMDASKGGFNAADSWDNDISGNGKLHKAGSGVITLTGDNSYQGGTVVEEGGVVGTSSNAFGTGDVFIKGGVLTVKSADSIRVHGNYKQIDGTTEVYLNGKASALTISGNMSITDGELLLRFPESYKPAIGSTLTVAAASKISGKFSSVTADGYNVTAIYANNTINITINSAK
jgi:autotransporter-associated beta strand protein